VTELKVGLLVIAGFLVLAYAIVRIGGPSSFWSDKIHVTAYFSSANGLRPGSDAWLDGLLVGKVTDVGLNRNPNEKAKVAVEMEIDATYQNLLRKDSVVGIESNGLLGDKTIQITSGSETAELVGDGGSLQGAEVGAFRESFRGRTKSSATSKRSATISPGLARMSLRFPRTSLAVRAHLGNC
jgi:phospholipid/cholesterol/gamma-HCH transport system substrate-binding protein